MRNSRARLNPRVPCEPTGTCAVSRRATQTLMKKTLLISSTIIAVALVGCNRSTRTETTAADTTVRTPEPTVGQRVDNAVARTDAAAREAGRDIANATERAGDKLERAGERTAAAAREMGHDIKAKFTEWKLNAQDLEADLAARRPIVRTKDSAGTPTGNMDKSTLQSAVEGRIKADAELANLKLDINADRKNEIQLEGKAQNADQIARAIALALDTDGVMKVTSKIRIDDDAVKNR